ncbi:NAD-dependent epimerase/dehydratase family protein [Roseomonas sp. SSH11]|uniref:NAD-dependent epimerase/dehydratase family protein n=1 Tax=Pararoseomonas baculiformis TaxID=2820812 RepID=A0ABS4AL60_9PROT|nr:NAD-dependent epimerase/dehydratase family protein [Pararoseomonas baculiformis]MBP0447233.1 NAD-dependent epimerase/dehydratase family protein [Pararoseomonas baculiformis]
MTEVLVTGASGFVGGHVMRRLRGDPALHAIAGTRDGRGGSRPLDLRSPDSILKALSGVEVVVHCAVGDRSVTVEGTRALLAAAAGADVRRVVHFSSISVYGDAPGLVTEDTPLIPASTPGYAGWKVAAEEACIAERKVETVRLRPTIIYGAGSTLWVAKMADRIQSGRWGRFGEAGEGTCNLVHVSDVAEAVAVAIAAPGAGGRAFNVNGAETMSWDEWFSRLGAAIGAPPLREIPPGRMRALSLLSLPIKAAARLRPGLAADWLLGAPARSEIALFGLKATYPTDAARAALGWVPRVGVEEGLRDSVAWLKSGRPSPA